MLDSLACALVKIIGGLLCRLPPGASVWFGRRLGDLASWAQPRRTQIGVLNLRAAFEGRLTPTQARRTIRACYRNMGAGLLELLRLPVIDRAYLDRYVTIDGVERFEAAATSGRPLILLTGHYGNWELSSIAAALLGHPIVALARAQERLPKLYRLLVSYRESKGCMIVHKGGAMKRLIEALQQRRPVGIVGDQASRQGLFAEFFGRPALFARGPFELAYSRKAMILPAFVHRVRGPFHRIAVETPIELDGRLPEQQAVRQGIEAFAGVLARHIIEDPAQWLWMHKRWKHTPARRALILSDGKRGHLKQSLAVIDALRATHPALTHDVIDIRYRNPLARSLALLWSWCAPGINPAACLGWTLSRESAAALLGRYADVIVSCGSAAVPANVLWAAENRAKSVVIMNPAPVPLARFDLVIAPRHDALPQRANVVITPGAVATSAEETQLSQAGERLLAHPRYRAAADSVSSTVAVFIGGDTEDYELTPAFAEALIAQVLAACERLHGDCLVTTSRRTSEGIERLLAERLGRHSRCRLLLLASKDLLDGTMDGMLGAAEVAVVTGESISMVSEACASGRRVVIVEPPLRRGNRRALTKHQRFLRGLEAEGYARAVPLPELSLAIQRAAKEPAAKRLDTFAQVRDAVGKLL